MSGENAERFDVTDLAERIRGLRSRFAQTMCWVYVLAMATLTFAQKKKRSIL